MLAKYVSNSSATVAQVVSDLALLAAGAAIASLSSGCDKVNSVILVNNDLTGWSLIDAAGPSSGKVLTAKDTVGTDKFINLYPSSNAMSVFGYESYNPTTHTGTASTGAANATMAIVPGTPLTAYVYATARNLLIMNNTCSAVHGSLEFTRDAPHLSSYNGYPAHGVIHNWNNTNIFSMTRAKNFAAAGDTTSSLNVVGIGSVGTNGYSYTMPYRDVTDSIIYPVLDAYAVGNAGSFGNLPFGKIYDVLLSHNTLGSFMDTVVIDGVTYFIVTSTVIPRMLVKYA